MVTYVRYGSCITTEFLSLSLLYEKCTFSLPNLITPAHLVQTHTHTTDDVHNSVLTPSYKIILIFPSQRTLNSAVT